MSGMGTYLTIVPVFTGRKPPEVMMRWGLNTEHHAAPGRFVSFIYNQGGLLVKWYRDTFARAEKLAAEKEGRDIYAQLMAEIPAGSFQRLRASPLHRHGAAGVRHRFFRSDRRPHAGHDTRGHLERDHGGGRLLPQDRRRLRRGCRHHPAGAARGGRREQVRRVAAGVRRHPRHAHGPHTRFGSRQPRRGHPCRRGDRRVPLRGGGGTGHGFSRRTLRAPTCGAASSTRRGSRSTGSCGRW